MAKKKKFPLYLTLLELHTRSTPTGSLACCSPSPDRCRASFLALPGDVFYPGSTEPVSMDQISRKCSPGAMPVGDCSNSYFSWERHRALSGAVRGHLQWGWSVVVPCFVEQHPHTLHDIWAGSIAVGSMSCGELQLSQMCPLGEQLFTVSTATQVCLTDGAKDECNVVEVVGRNHENQEIAVPVANLKLSCQPLVRG